MTEVTPLEDVVKFVEDIIEEKDVMSDEKARRSTDDALEVLVC